MAAFWPLGIIEGFYGRQWSWAERRRWPSFLADAGFNTYIYAPKGDACLRSRWRDPWPEAELAELADLAGECRAQGIAFGVGLSPLGYADTGHEDDERAALADKLDQIASLTPDILCLLFDDMRGDDPSLAFRQCALTDWVLARSPARQHIVCPTYYSHDRILEQVFGAMPLGYLSELGAGLPPDVGVFWTGNVVCSPAYNEQCFNEVSGWLRRRPVLWDNHPVNDGRRSSRFLPLGPLSGRPPALREWTAGHLANPMNQPALSRLPLRALGNGYRRGDNPGQAWHTALHMECDEPLARLIARDASRFQYAGLDSLSSPERERLAGEYRAVGGAMACEVADWLEEGYRFDPACLTE